MDVEDTIAAVATPLGEGGLGVVRLSGPRALDVASSLFRCPQPLAQAPTHTAHHGHIIENGRPVDEAVAVLFRAPRSYTGEDVVELSCHGGLFLVKRVLGLCLASGARAAGPGEFTRRAFTNGKMDLAQAEAVADLIAAKSETFRRLALEQLEGRLSGHLGGLRRRTLDLLAHLEANLDFAEEEVPALSKGALAEQARALRADVQALLETAPRGRVLREGLRAVLVGRPNVGKSSLFNALLGADRAIVTEVPGTTRDTLEERLLLDEVPVVLTDTAGLRPGAGRVEGEGIARARRALERADVALFVMDASQPPSPDDSEVESALGEKRKIVILNKCDVMPPAREKEWLSRWPGARPVFTSAASGKGLDALRGALLESAGGSPSDAEPPAVPTLISQRHEALLKEAAAALETAAAAEDECAAVDLRRALDRLNEITGEGAPDELLENVFSRFCIGK